MSSVAPIQRRPRRRGRIRRSFHGLRRRRRSPGQLWLWGLTIATAVLAAVVQQPHGLSAFLARHQLPRWPLHPLGLPLVGWWTILFVANEICVRRAAARSTSRWIGEQQTLLGKTSGSIDLLCRSLAANRGSLTDDGSRAIARALLARIAEHARLLVNEHRAEFRACCLVLRQDPAGGAAYLEAWEYDAPHNDARYSRLALGQPLAGEVAQTRTASFLNDVLDPEVETHFPNRRYRAIIGFPVLVGGPGGELLGVVTIDSSLPGVFAREVGADLEQAVSPLIALIGFALKFTRRARIRR